MIVRDAIRADLPSLLVIHNDAIATTTAIWDERQVDLEDRRHWLETRQSSGFPVLVAEVDGEVAGYASYGPWRPKSGYRFTVENSIYTHPDHRGRGVASALMPVLLERALAGQVHAIVAGIESTNAVSIALHEKHGFRRVAHLPQVGFKFGRWLDLDYLQLSVGNDPSRDEKSVGHEFSD